MHVLYTLIQYNNIIYVILLTFFEIYLKNLESSSVSCRYATLLLDSALDSCQWDLSKDLVRFLKAIGKNLLKNFFFVQINYLTHIMV